MKKWSKFDSALYARAPAPLVRAVEAEAERRFTTPSQIVRDAVATHLGMLRIMAVSPATNQEVRDGSAE